MALNGFKQLARRLSEVLEVVVHLRLKNEVEIGRQSEGLTSLVLAL